MSERIEVDNAKSADSGRVVDKPAECANGCPPMQVCDFCQDAPVWRAEWAGSAPGRGWYIREGSHLTNAPVVAYLGDNIDKVLVREMVEAHNATVHRDKSLAAQGQGEKSRDFIVDDAGYFHFYAAPPASPAGVPDGMALVPRTPTIEMVAAGHNTYLGAPNMACFGLVWKAMLAAATSAPESNT